MPKLINSRISFAEKRLLMSFWHEMFRNTVFVLASFEYLWCWATNVDVNVNIWEAWWRHLISVISINIGFIHGLLP